jgi:hypothetical protein
MPQMCKSFHKNGLVLAFEKTQTEGLKEGTKQNVTDGPVLAALLDSRVATLQVGMDLQVHWQN